MNWIAQHLNVMGVVDWLEFFREGWENIVKPECARDIATYESFMKMLFHVASLPEDEGAVVLFTSKNLKPLGFYILCDNTERFAEKRSLLIYAGYSNGKYAGAARESIEYIERWAKEHGYSDLQAHTRRMTGAAVRLYERKLGFEMMSWVFRKNI